MPRPRDANGRFAKQGPAKIAADPDIGRSSDAFLNELRKSWVRHGAATIEKVRCDRPHDYLRLVAAGLAKQGEGQVDALETLSDDEIAEELRRILSRLDPESAETGA